jgi:hypothetical protein
LPNTEQQPIPVITTRFDGSRVADALTVTPAKQGARKSAHLSALLPITIKRYLESKIDSLQRTPAGCCSGPGWPTAGERTLLQHF